MFYSGFCLQNEAEIFNSFLQDGGGVVGFSYGAMKAAKYALTNKIKEIILLSPAYYCHTSEDFRSAQLAAFGSDPSLYKLKLLKKSGLNEGEIQKYGNNGRYDELNELLYFDWDGCGIVEAARSGLSVKVFIGSDDRVVEPVPSSAFFSTFANVTVLEGKNHILR